LKRHLSVANVLSCLALFVALGGSAFAAVKLNANQVKAFNIAKQAVTNPKIKQQAITSGKIKNGTVNALDLGAGQVTGEKIDRCGHRQKARQKSGQPADDRQRSGDDRQTRQWVRCGGEAAAVVLRPADQERHLRQQRKRHQQRNR
jgi:hypothetical protein